MKTELRLAPHAILPGQQVVEVWHDGQFLGQVVGADGPGIRVLTKHALAIALARQLAPPLQCLTVQIDPKKGAVE